MIRTIALAFCATLSMTAFAADDPIPMDWKFIAKKMKKADFKPKFVTAMKAIWDTSDFNQTVELNCLLFLRKTDYHGPQVSDQSADDVRAFIMAHEKSFASAEKKYHVPPAVVASLIWMESRFGVNQGRFHVASVFLNLIQAERPQVIAHLKLEAAPRFTPKLTTQVARDITDKAKARAKWAIGELKSVQEMWERDPKSIETLKGSFAGAFGLAQFLPSSYVHYARSARKKTPDLTRPADAIHSVAYYLKESGWKTKKLKSHEKALLAYNKSTDYARAILRLAGDADPELRQPASTEKPKKKKKKKKSAQDD